jgi:hypothetical protein
MSLQGFWIQVYSDLLSWTIESNENTNPIKTMNPIPSNRKMPTFGLSFLGWYLLACMRTLVRWVMCLGVNKEFIFTGVSLSDTCFNKTQIRIFSSRYFSLHCWNHETSHRNICYIQTILNMPTQDYNWQQMKKKPKYHLTSTMCDRKNFVVTYWHTWYRTLYRWASNSTLANQHLWHRRQCSYSGCCHHQILGGPVKCEQHLRVHATILLSKCKQEAEHRWHAVLSD